MKRIPLPLRISAVAWVLALTVLLPTLNLVARPLPAHADGSGDPTPTATATATPEGWGGESDDDDG